MFWRSGLIKSVGGLDATLQYSFSHDFWVRCLLSGYQPFLFPQPVACFRLHPHSKTCSAQDSFMKQDWLVFNRYQHLLEPAEARKARKWLREYEVGILASSVYGLLAAGKRSEAAKLLLGRMNLYPAVRPKKLLAGLLFRTLVTGSPPGWFRWSGAT
jgi:hypothetical protein